MTGRHRKPARLSKEGRRLLGGAALLAIFAPVTAYTLNAAIAHVQSCGTEVDLKVAAAPEMAAALEDFVAAGGGEPSRGSDVCADITVEAVASDQIAGTEADVWIPETDLWLAIPEAGLADQWVELRDSTASSAVGIALPEGESPDQVVPTEADIALQDPRHHAASLMWIVVFGVDADTAAGSGGNPVMSGPEVTASNAETGEALQIPIGAAQIGQFEYPMLIAAGLDAAKEEAAENLLRSYGSPKYPELLAEHGLTTAIPETAPRSEDVVAQALARWDEHVSG